MLDATVLGQLMATYALEGKDNIDTPIEAFENKTTRQITEESMTKLARAIVEHFQSNAEFEGYIPSGQHLVSINGANTTPGMQTELTIDGGVILPALIRTPGALGDEDDTSQIKVIVTVQ